MRRNLRCIALCVLLAGLTLTSGGCVVVAAGAAAGAAVAWHKGDLTVSYSAPPTQVMQAASDAIREMGLTIVSEDATALDGKIVARTATDQRVELVAKADGPDVTSVSIRFGVFGDHERSVALHNRIRDRLAE